jgi:hypothetical protein
VKISCKEDVYICRTNFAKQMERNLHETTSRWKTYGKQLFSKDLEVRDVPLVCKVVYQKKATRCFKIKNIRTKSLVQSANTIDRWVFLVVVCIFPQNFFLPRHH